MSGGAGDLEVVVGIGGVRVCVRTEDAGFRRLLLERYAGFIEPPSAGSDVEFAVELIPPDAAAGDSDVRVRREGAQWRIERGDFLALFDPSTARGKIRQSANPYSIDSVLRIVHSLVLARQGGFLLHAASAVRNGRAFVLTGVSGAGKTTIARLAPPDVRLLTDEISYLRQEGDGYVAYGTPFAGELGHSGENLRAPLAAVYLLAQGPDNRIEPLGAAEAGRALLRNILFFAEDPALVQALFGVALDFVQRVPMHRLTFMPDQRVWELIQ